ncbi:MAG: ferredoxin [Pseudomonadota bacterium]
MQNKAVSTDVGDKKWTASDYSDYNFNLGFSAPKKTTVPESTVEEASGRVAMPASVPDVSNNEDILYTLRHFHLGDPSTNEKTETVGDDYVPALLHVYRDSSNVRYDYPLFLSPAENAEAEAEQLVRPISHVLRERVESFAPGAEAARILKDNLARIERELRQTLKEKEGPVGTRSLLSEVGQTLQNELGLDEENNARLQADFDKLLDLIPTDAQLLGYGHYAAIHLLNHAIRCRLIPRRTSFHEKIKQRIRGLKKLLDVDWHKSDESIEPKMARDSVGCAGERFDPDVLSEMMDHSQGTVVLSAERRERILNALQVLEEYLQEDDPIMIRLVHLGNLTGTWLENIPAFEAFSDQEPCAKATALFDQQTAKLAKVFGAARIAQLEIDDVYDPGIHDPWFANLTWEAFSSEEMLLLPAVIALESAERVANSGMGSLSRLLSSGRPVQILVRVRAHSNPYALSDEEPFLNYRLELGSLGISHRQAVVSQSSAARHRHMLTQFLSALDATRTSLHIINTGVQHSAHGINAWLVAGSALESRAHPFFHINPEKGDSSADRMDFTGNPQPEVDWPSHPFQYQNENDETVTTELAFTFADYALLVPRIRHHFRLVPAGFDNEDLIPVEKYLSGGCKKEIYKRIPFIWAVNGKGELRKLVISRSLIFACLDRLNYWHTLQELAGIHNKYVDMAVQKARDEILAEEGAERDRLQAEHAAEIEKVRNETAGEVMQRLTDMLLGLDLTKGAQPIIRAPAATPSPAPATEPVTEAESEPAPEEVEEEVVFDEPWIDSVLCTSCNDCLNINTVLFVYNDSKQAIIGDLSSGTYAQLVEGAEICPARCIYPGKPQNPDEPGLDDLIKRAEPFNKL